MKSKNAEYQQKARAQNPEKVAEYQQTCHQNNPGNRSWGDGHEKTATVCQDPSFKKGKGEVLYVADASNLLIAVATNMGKIPDTNYVRNNAGAAGGRKEDMDQDNSKDQMREQRRLYLKDCLNFETQTEYSEYAAPLGAGAVPPGTYCQTPQCHLVKRPRLRGLPD